MWKSIIVLVATALISLLSVIADGVLEAKALSSRVEILEHSNVKLKDSVNSFQRDIARDIGEIKGQNKVIIEILSRKTKE